MFEGKTTLAATAAAAIASLGLYTFSPRITEQDAALKIVRGELRNSLVEPGVKLDAILPHVEYLRLPATLQRITVHAGEDNQVAVRTREKAQVYGDFEIHFTLNKAHPRFGEIYTKLKCNDVKDLEPFIKNYALPAIIDSYRTVDTANVNDNLTVLGKKIAADLQKIVDLNYPFINIVDVIPSGVGLSAQANSDLEKIVSEERKLALQIVQGQVADAAIALTKKQTSVTTSALNDLREAGVPEKELTAVYYLQLLRDSDSVGKQGVPGPVPGTGMNGVITKTE
jgi:hypothetical protein